MTEGRGETTGAAFELPVRVYYEDTDAGGVVYYANYLKFFERARTEWLRSLGFNQQALVGERGLLFAVRSVEVHYLAPARLDDMLTVELRVERIRRASIDFAQSIRHNDGSADLCTARVKVACLEADSFRPAVIPDDIKDSFPGVIPL